MPTSSVRASAFCRGSRPRQGSAPAAAPKKTRSREESDDIGGRRATRRRGTARRLICWGYVPRREPSQRLGSSPPRPCGPRCRPEAGVPSRPRASAQAAVRGFAALRAAVPAGGRRSKPSPRFCSSGSTRFRGPVGRGAGRRSADKPSPRFCSGGGSRCRPVSRVRYPPDGGLPLPPARRRADVSRASPRGPRKSRRGCRR